jgi:hypothetical protein
VKHQVSIKSRPSRCWKKLSGRPVIVRYWSCICGRAGPEFHDPRVDDDGVLRGGRVHVTRANRTRKAGR